MRKTGKSRFHGLPPVRFPGSLSLGKKIMLLTVLGLLVGAGAMVLRAVTTVVKLRQFHTRPDTFWHSKQVVFGRRTDSYDVVSGEI
jgi:hypothetical protein